MTTKSSSPKSVRIKPAGWLAIAVLVVLVVGSVGVLIQPVTHQPVPLAAAITPLPTWTPVPSATPIPSATPLPGGWTQQTGLAGKPYLAPPVEIEQQIKTAFTAVLACGYVEDAPDAALRKQPDKATLCDQARQAAGSGFIVPEVMSNGREVDTFGPLNPVQCQSSMVCTIARAKLEVTGVLVTTAADCKTLKSTAPCVYRGAVKGPEPDELLIATVSLENRQWKVTHLNVQKLPGPPPAP